MACPTEQALLTFARGTAAPEERAALIAHVDACAECRQAVAEAIRAARDREATADERGAFAKTEIAGASPFDGAPRPALRPGDRVARYSILALLGRGAMGVVYSAFDPELSRKVALKVIHASVADAALQQRLLREAQALAQLSHPNVVAVFDAGIDGDQVFIAMEQVEGDTLRQWLLQPRPWREVLDQFLDAGRGLAAAHERGVIHRDFKPDNVLVGSDGRVRVTDFGLARLTGEQEGSAGAPLPEPSFRSPISTITLTGQVVGTPAYMSPEQRLAASVDARTDQYAFAVSLYEGLFGVRPGEESSATASRPGGRVPRGVRPTLERAMHPLAAERYAGMAELLAQLERVAPRNAARTRMQAALTALALLTVAGAVVWSTWTMRRRAHACEGAAALVERAWNPAIKAKGHAAFAATGLSYGEDAWQHVEAAMDAYAGEWSEARTEACLATRVRGERTERQLSLRLSCLDQRSRQLSVLASIFATADKDVVARAGNAVRSLSPSADCANLHALESLGDAVPEALRAKVDDIRQRVAQSRAVTAAGKFADARQVLDPAVQAADELALPLVQSEARYALGYLFDSMGLPLEAGPEYERAARAAEAAGDDAAVAGALIKLVSVVGWKLEKPDEGRPIARFAAGVVQRLGNDAHLRATLALAAANVAYQAGDLDGSIISYQEALASFATAGEVETGDVVQAHTSLGWSLMERWRLSEAEGEMRTALSQCERLFGRNHPKSIFTLNALGSLEDAKGDVDAAAEWYARTLAVAEQFLGPKSPALVAYLANLAHVLVEAGRLQEARAAMDRYEAILQEGPVEKEGDRYDLLSIRAQILEAEGRLREAIALERRALSIREAAMGRNHRRAAITRSALAGYLAEGGDAQEALAVNADAEKGLGLKASAPDHDLALILQTRGVALARLHRSREALDALEQAIAICDATPGPPVDAALARFELARVLWSSGTDRARAVAEARKASAVFEQKHARVLLARTRAWLAGTSNDDQGIELSKPRR